MSTAGWKIGDVEDQERFRTCGSLGKKLGGGGGFRNSAVEDIGALMRSSPAVEDL